MASPTRVLLVRHGQARANVERIIAGPRGCTGLTDTGRTEAGLLGRRLAASGPRPDALICSPLPRARETAQIVGEHLGTTPDRVDGDLVELDPGQADGLSDDAYAKRYGHFDMLLEPDRPFAPGGESWSAFRTRAETTMEQLSREFQGRTVLCVCHAGFIVGAMVTLLDIPRPGNTTDLSPQSTSITEFGHDGGRWNLVRYNDHAHLESPGPSLSPT
ncbi:histidine phosphatase family protein [Streptacidiphilus sp. P02-A3a]|uniref:histidine phosphatase family protein n=1 Tax=Streptacidiphilus sp. P02-A3a TaxID=2704468 RepID=UPI0015FAABFB|nr:histidine phosphatase family protein [Streptacidiphilus sp. P02-A3a]QMU69769.1 histidine phosphatase family protein [Streptacidiphilus sp. P02-A3a]